MAAWRALAVARLRAVGGQHDDVGDRDAILLDQDVERDTGGCRILDTLIDPNIIVLLLSLGALGITVELFNPGLIFPGTFGAISLIVAFFGLQVLPVSAAGILLILLAAAFFAAEPFVMSHGALALAGAACFVVGSLMLFDPAGDTYQVSTEVALGVAATMALLVALVVTKLVQVRRAQVVTGQEDLIGEIAYELA